MEGYRARKPLAMKTKELPSERGKGTLDMASFAE
jgi:hypothetical protein